MHVGDVASGSKSKTEAMFIPAHKPEAPVNQTEATADFEVEEGISFVSFCQKFTYLGSLLTPDLDDKHDIQRRIQLGSCSFRELKKVLTDRRI